MRRENKGISDEGVPTPALIDNPLIDYVTRNALENWAVVVVVHDFKLGGLQIGIW